VIWLVGHPLARIEEPSQLPVRGVTLRRIYHEMNANKATLPIACGTVADEIMSFWVNANITTTAKPHAVTKLKALHQEQEATINHTDWFGLEAAFTLQTQHSPTS